EFNTGVRVVAIEGTLPAVDGCVADPAPANACSLSTTDTINTCAGDSTTGKVVCTGNQNNIYVYDGTKPALHLTSTLVNGVQHFPPNNFTGNCQTCNVAIDPKTHTGFISIATADDVAALQPIILGTSTDTPALSVLPIPLNQRASSEAILVDPG